MLSEVIESKVEWMETCRVFFRSPLVAVIVYLDPGGSLTSFSMACRDSDTGKVVPKYVPVGHLFGKNAPLSRADLSFFFSTANLSILGSGYLSPILHLILGSTPNVIFDPELLVHSCGITLEGLGPLVQKFLGTEVSKVEDAFQESGRRLCEASPQDSYLIDLVTRDILALYDLSEEVSRRVKRKELTSQHSMEDLLLLNYISWEMSCSGYVIDTVRADHLVRSLEKSLEDREEKLRKVFGESVNLESPAQVSRFLYSSKSEGGLGLPVKEKTEQGAPSVSQKALESLRGEHPVINDLLLYKKDQSALKVIQKMLEVRRGTLLYPTWVYKSGGVWSSQPCLTLVSDFRVLDVVSSFSECTWVGIRYEERQEKEFSDILESYAKPLMFLERSLVWMGDVYPEDLIRTYYFGILGWSIQVKKSFSTEVFENLLKKLPHPSPPRISWGDTLGSSLVSTRL